MSEIWMELCEISHRYGVELLSTICLAMVKEKSISSKNALNLFEFALTYDVENIIHTYISISIQSH